MARRPFDPFRARGAPRDPGPPARREQRSFRHLGEAEELTVSELAQLIRTTVEQRIASPLRVIGQVSNLSARNHWYFSLKDDDAVVSCVAWASTAQKFGFVPNDGDEVVATGHVGFFPKNGRLQLYVSALVPLGAGALHQRFQAMCTELRDRGFFDPAHKKPVPAFPRRVAVITSAGGAAVHDVVATAKQRCPAVGLLIVDARVQGDGAAASVARAIRWVDRHRERLGVDAILVTRGGGSMEDLWAFNELPVAEAAFACALPLVAAIGHESDTTVIELVADERAATPTQAAMRLVPSRDELRQQVDHYGRRLDVILRARIERERQRLRAVAAYDFFRAPRAFIARHGQRLDVSARELDRASRRRIAEAGGRLEQATARLRHAATRRLERARLHLDAQARAVRALDPRSVLHRGFSYTTGARGLVRAVADVRAGDVLTTHLADGSVRSRALGGTPAAGDQMDLFDDTPAVDPPDGSR